MPFMYMYVALHVYVQQDASELVRSSPYALLGLTPPCFFDCLVIYVGAYSQYPQRLHHSALVRR